MRLDVGQGQVVERRGDQTIKVQADRDGHEISMKLNAKVKLSFKPGKYVRAGN